MDKTHPLLTAKEGQATVNLGDSKIVSNYFNLPSFSISGGSSTLVCNLENTNELIGGFQNVSCTAKGGNGLTATKEIIVVSSMLKSTLLSQYSSSNTTGLLYDEIAEYYYKGTNEEVANNWVWYEGHLYRVIEVDDEGITMITSYPLTSISTTDSANIDRETKWYINRNINVYSLLDDIFLPSISDQSLLINNTNIENSIISSSIGL